MKLLALVALIFAAPAFAQSTASRKKITCSKDYQSKVYDEAGQLVSDDKVSEKTSESIRTTWIEGDIEYRHSNYTSFVNDQPRSIGQNIMKLTKKTLPNGLVEETSEYHDLVRYLDVLIDGKSVVERKSVTVATFKVEGNKRTLVKSTLNGKPEPGTSVETETKISDRITEYKSVESVPYIFEDGNYLVEVLHSEINCQYELLD